MTPEEDSSADYLAYLLRLWRTPGGVDTSWRGSLENAHTKEVRGFGSLKALFAFLVLETQTQDAPRFVADTDPDQEDEGDALV